MTANLWLVWILVGIAALGLLLLYYVLLARAVLEMLRRDANTVLMTFAFLALIPVPPLLILGILIIIIWNIHKMSVSEIP